MDKMSPYQALLQTKGINKKDLPSEIQSLIKRIESTKNTVLVNKKTDEYGNPMVSPETEKKISDLDSMIVNRIWDYSDDKQRSEIRKSVPNPKEETKQVYADVKEEVKTEVKEQFLEPKEEPKKQGSSGTIGFFDW